MKTAAAESATLVRLKTLAITNIADSLEPCGNEFTRTWFDGPFFQSPVPPHSVPQVSLVFVQSQDGNTVAADPSALGAGETDKHLVYEGLSRTTADAVLAGARTVDDGEMVFSVWHPELVALRASKGKPRHPAQVVATLSGTLPLARGLLFNTPAVPVVILTARRSAATLERQVRPRPWVSLLDGGARSDVRAFATGLRSEFGYERISAIGGRTIATALVDAGLVSDLYLTTSQQPGGAPDTPWYAGSRPPHRELVLRKQDESTGATFEHWLLHRE